MTGPHEGTSCPAPAEPDFGAQQREVQRKLGRCMFRLQQYEILAKALAGNREFLAPAGKMHEVKARSVALAAGKTLGQLVGELTGGFLTPHQPEMGNTSTEIEDGFGDDQQAWFRFSSAIELPPEHHQQLVQDLAGLVKMRNELVHHFIERFDISSAEGCLVADSYLQGCYESIDGHFLTLRAWVERMNHVRKVAADFIRSPEGINFLVNGIAPDDEGVDWGISPVVQLLKKVEEISAVEGWTLLNTAIAFIREKDPEQTPRKYQCSSWREVIHKSQLFEIQKDKSAGEKGTLVWYRSKPMPVLG